VLNIVIFSGGRGTTSISKAFLDYPNCRLISIVNAYDDGLSTGLIRRFFGMLGPSDIRKTQQSMLSPAHPNFAIYDRIFSYRFPAKISNQDAALELRAFAAGDGNQIGDIEFPNERWTSVLRNFTARFLSGLETGERKLGETFDFADASLLNCFYAGAFLTFRRDFDYTTRFFDRFFEIRGNVLTTNTEDKKLVAIRENGEVLYSEAEIVELRSNARIRDLFIVDEYPNPAVLAPMAPEERFAYLTSMQTTVRASDAVLRAIADADILIYGPGTQHSSLYPSYMTSGVTAAIAAKRDAVKIFICNIGEDYEIPEYTASELVDGAYRYLARNAPFSVNKKDLFNFVIANNPANKGNQKYIPNDASKDKLDIVVISENMEAPSDLGKHNGDLVATRCMSLYQDFLLADIPHIDGM